MKNVKGPGDSALRTLDTTVADLRPPKQVAAAAPDQLEAPGPAKEKRRAPLISLFGVDIDVAAIKEKIRSTFAPVGDSALISLIINATGAAFTHYAMGIPFDLKIAAAYMVIGTAVGTAYFPMKQAVMRVLHGAADAAADPHKAGDSS
ncbi:MAG: hypothetical protein U1E65_11145 [Myxococcota bacterium]